MSPCPGPPQSHCCFLRARRTYQATVNFIAAQVSIGMMAKLDTNLIESGINKKTCLWVGLWGHFKKGLAEGRRLSPVLSTFFWGDPDTKQSLEKKQCCLLAWFHFLLVTEPILLSLRLLLLDCHLLLTLEPIFFGVQMFLPFLVCRGQLLDYSAPIL